MAVQKGRSVLLKISDGTSPGLFTTIGGMRSKSLSIQNQGVETTTIDSDEWRTLQGGDDSIRTFDISGSGVFIDDAPINLIEDLAFSRGIEEFQLVFGNSDIFQGMFTVSSFTWSGEFSGVQNFSMSLQSSSAISLIRCGNYFASGYIAEGYFSCNA